MHALKDRWPFLLLLVAYVSYALYAIFCGERIPVNGGLGWDGQIYYFISQDLFSFVEKHVLDSFYILRIVPSLLVKGMHWLSGTEHSYELTGAYFGLLNLASVLGGSYFLIQSLSPLTAPWKWVVAVLTLGSFGMLKHPYYYPILTDSFAFLLGSGILWAYLNGRKWMLGAFALIGAFTFPSISMIALPLLAFKNDGMLPEPNERWNYWPLVLLLFVVALLAVLGPAFNGSMPFDTMQPTRSMVLVSLPFMLVYLALLWRGVDVVGRLQASLSAMSWSGVAIWTLLLSLTLIAGAWAKPSPFTLPYFASHSIAYGLAHPAVFVVAHVIYFGPVFLLALFFWKTLKQQVIQLPLPLFWSMMLILSMLIRSESRTMIAGLPFIIHAVAMALKDLKWQWWQQVAIVVVSLAMSKCWFTINNGEMTAALLEFPMQRYMMHIGPWMSTTGYLINLTVVVVSGLLIWVVIRPDRQFRP